MNSKCPLCGQNLPAGIDERALHARMERLTASAKATEAKRIKAELAADFRKREAEVRRAALRQAEVQAQANARKLVEKETARYRKAAEARIQHARHEARQEATREAAEKERALREKLDAECERQAGKAELQRLRHQNDMARMQKTVEDLQRQLENRPNEQRGAEAEDKLLKLLKETFQEDRIKEVGRGKKGADIIHKVMDGGKVAGCIVYESKDTKGWQNAFIAKARQARSIHEADCVIIVTRAFPPKGRGKGLWVEKGIPVVEPGMAAVALARIIREGIKEISSLRVSGIDRDRKAQKLFVYILSDGFKTRFREITAAVQELRDNQDKERGWHDRAWSRETTLHEQIAEGHRKIDAQIKEITQAERIRTRRASQEVA